MDLEIRHAYDNEYEDVATLIVDAFAEYAASMSPDAWSMFAQDIANVHGRRTNGEIIVALRNGELVGTMTVYRQWRGSQPGTLSLRLMAVRPSSQGSGVGGALMEWAVAEAKSTGKHRIVLMAMQMMDAVRDILNKHGFARVTDLDHEAAPGVRVEGYALEIAPAE